MTSTPEKILVIRLKAIGDALLGLPVCGSLKKTYPEAQIDYLVYEHIKPLFLNHPDIDNVVTISAEERSSAWLYAKRMLCLRSQKYDMVIDLINVPVSAWMTFLCGAKYTLGFDKKRWRSKLYKTEIEHTEYGDTVGKKLDILKGLPHAATVEKKWQLAIELAETELMKQKLITYGVDFQRPVFFVAATSNAHDKTWPMNYMAEVMNHLCEKYDAQLIVNCVPGREQQLVNDMLSLLEDPKDVFRDIQLNLRELAIAISLCDFFFGNDGGPSHMATGTNVPSLMVYSPIHEKISWLPQANPRHQGVDLQDSMGITSEEHRSIRSHMGRHLETFYQSITPEIVITKLDDMLGEFIV